MQFYYFLINHAAQSDQKKMKFTSNVNTPRPNELKLSEMPKISENRPLMKPRTSLVLVSNSSERDSDDKLILNPYIGSEKKSDF